MRSLIRLSECGGQWEKFCIGIEMKNVLEWKESSDKTMQQFLFSLTSECMRRVNGSGGCNCKRVPYANHHEKPI
jgi:hypothetical protein